VEPALRRPSATADALGMDIRRRVVSAPPPLVAAVAVLGYAVFVGTFNVGAVGTAILALALAAAARDVTVTLLAGGSGSPLDRVRTNVGKRPALLRSR
jgi:hypothetical protein